MIKRDKNLFLRQSRGKKWKSLRNRLGQRKNQTITMASHNRRISGCYGNHRDLYGLLFTVTTADEDRRAPVHCSPGSAMAVVNFLEP